MKVIVWNGLNPQNKIKRLVFITEKAGSKQLNKKFIEEYLKILSREDIDVKIEYV